MSKICQYLKPISISLSPNTEKDDIWLALKLVFCPWKWIRLRQGFGLRPTKSPSADEVGGQEKVSATEELEEEFKKYLGVKYAFAFNSGRSSLMAILKSLDLEPGSEVLLQAFTCNAAANPIIWSGLKPVYVDCDEDNFNIDIEDLNRKITPKSKVVIVQHTFGLPAEMAKILEIAKQNNLILIEDGAHSLGAEVGLPADFVGRRRLRRPKAEALAKAGTFGKAAFFSFSRDKIISSVYGGMVVTNGDNLAKEIKEFQEETNYPSRFWIFQQLLHPILMNFLILPTYKILLGKIILILCQRFRILSKAVHWKEKRGRKPSYFPKRMPNALALLALNQFKKLEKFNKHRQKIADFYYETLKNSSFGLPQRDNSIFLRFTIKHPEAHDIIKKAWKRNILIGDWYTSPIAPEDTDLGKIGYKLGSCPKAEKLSKQTFNLPTHINISTKQAQKIINFLKTWK